MTSDQLLDMIITHGLKVHVNRAMQRVHVEYHRDGVTFNATERFIGPSDSEIRLCLEVAVKRALRFDSSETTT